MDGYVEFVLGGPLDGAVYYLDDPTQVRLSISIGGPNLAEYTRISEYAFAFVGYGVAEKGA